MLQPQQKDVIRGKGDFRGKFRLMVIGETLHIMLFALFDW